ncbi:MAG: sugar phosphate nucleotidyltransferase, partial [Maritimibacter sp.]
MITPVLLCGGSGTRLWPLSRKSYPKQFLPLIGEATSFQMAMQRVATDEFAPPLVLTNSDFRFIVAEQLGAAGATPGAILLEPEGRNTAPAVLAAALHVAESDPDGVLLVAPSDHVVEDVDAFHRAIAQGLAAVEAGQLVTFGITPTHAETAYGYLELSAQPDGSGAPVS